ncbi:hypothetical protein RI367_004392 [Sorochytrium milnesiophthora]
MQARGFIVAAAVALLLLLTATTANARQNLELDGDDRTIIALLEFGYLSQGTLEINVQNLKMEPKPKEFVGVLIRKSRRVLASDALNDEDGCPLDADLKQDKDYIVAMDKVNTDLAKMVVDEEAYWTITYHAANANGNLLSAGQMFLPTIYAASAVVNVVFIFLFSRQFRMETARVFWVHRLMLLLLVLTVLQKVFLAAQYHSMQAGIDTRAYDIISYIFTVIKSSLAVTIIGLLAAGWSFIKPYLSERDRKLIMFIIPLQVIANVAHVMELELAIGSLSSIFWSRVLPIVDISSFLIILYAIIQTRKHLTQAADTDGKAKSNLDKYQLWGTLYLATFVYLYLTRIISLFLKTAVPFKVLWLSEAFDEIVTGIFYIFIGRRFSPSSANPYTELHTATDTESGLQLNDLYAELDEEDEDNVPDVRRR